MKGRSVHVGNVVHRKGGIWHVNVHPPVEQGHRRLICYVRTATQCHPVGPAREERYTGRGHQLVGGGGDRRTVEWFIACSSVVRKRQGLPVCPVV